MCYEEEKKHPQTKLEVIRGGGDGGKGKTAVGTGNSGASPDPTKRRAVVCDKDETIRRGLSLMLLPFAEVVAEAADGPSAYQAIWAHKPDLVLIDIELESRTGLQVLQQFDMNDMNAHFLVSTDSYCASQYFYRFLRAGASGFYLKSSGKTILHRCVLDLIEKGSCCDPEIERFIFQKPPAAAEFGLTEDENKVLPRLALVSALIALELNTDSKTVNEIIAAIVKKLNVDCPSAAFLKATTLGYELLPKILPRNAEGMTDEHLLALKHAQAEIDRNEGNR